MQLLRLLSIVVLFIGLGSSTFIQSSTIDSCFINFKGTKKLTAQAPDQLPDAAALPREVNTESGIVSVSRVAGYRVFYLNDKKVPFVNLKVEQSAAGSYETDKVRLIDNLNYLIKNASGTKSKEIIELEFNGHKIYGLSRNSLAQSSTLGTFIMFPGDDITVYFYFNNLKPAFRNFKSLKDYEKQRDRFLNDYTKHLENCK